MVFGLRLRRGLDHATPSLRFAALGRSNKQASKEASKHKEKRREKDKREKTEKKKDAQKEPDDLQQFCASLPK